MKAKNFFSAVSIVLAMMFTFSCSEAQAAGQSDFYGVWVAEGYRFLEGGRYLEGSWYFEINKEAITEFRVFSGLFHFVKHKYRIVKWEKETNKNFIVYTLSEKNEKIDFKVNIDAYSDLQISFGGGKFEAKKNSTAELNKAIKEADPREAARKAAAQKAAKAVVQRGSFSDQRDGKTYKTVKIGSQTWMAENLNYNASSNKCYKNNESNCATYGRLYDWSTTMALPSSCNENSCSSQIQSKHRGICPSGWHIPSKDELQELVDFAGGDEVAGTYLKAKIEWAKTGNGTDDYGFSALPGGGGSSDSSFFDVGNYGTWWNASEVENYYSEMIDQPLVESNNSMSMGYDYDGVDWNGDGKSNLFSVRCVQD